jgi:hypothetical protein
MPSASRKGQDTETAAFAMEGDALDQPGVFLGRGLALWHSGGHEWGFIFPRFITNLISKCLAPMGRIVEVYGQT